MNLKFEFYGQLKPSSKFYDKKKQSVSLGLTDRLFYLLSDKKQTLINHSDIKGIYVIKEGKQQILSVDDFFQLYKAVLF